MKPTTIFTGKPTHTHTSRTSFHRSITRFMFSVCWIEHGMCIYDAMRGQRTYGSAHAKHITSSPNHIYTHWVLCGQSYNWLGIQMYYVDGKFPQRDSLLWRTSSLVSHPRSFYIYEANRAGSIHFSTRYMLHNTNGIYTRIRQTSWIGTRPGIARTKTIKRCGKLMMFFVHLWRLLHCGNVCDLQPFLLSVWVCVTGCGCTDSDKFSGESVCRDNGQV